MGETIPKTARNVFSKRAVFAKHKLYLTKSTAPTLSLCPAAKRAKTV